MKTQSLPDGSLLLQERWRSLRVICTLGAVVVPLVIVPAQLSSDSMNWRWLAGVVMGSAGLLLIAAVLEDRLFRFDVIRRQLTWERRNWFHARGATVPFDDIKDVSVIATSNRDVDHSFGGYMVNHTAVLRTSTETLQLSATHSIHKPDYEHICDAVLAVLTRGGSTPMVGDPIERLIAGGRMIEAVALIRAQRNVGLAQARQAAQEIRDGMQHDARHSPSGT